jgi:hypothetical protein
MQQHNLVAVLERILFDGADHPREDGIRDGRNHNAEQLGGVGAQPAGGGVRHVTHGLGNLAKAQLGGR